MSSDSQRGDGWVTPQNPNPSRPCRARRKILTTPLSPPSSEKRLLHSRRKPFGTPLLGMMDDNWVRDPWFSAHDSTSHLFIPEIEQQQYIVKQNIKRPNKQRSFSNDVLQLSRNLCYHQQKVMLRKRSMSTIDIVIPPKRIKIHAVGPSFPQSHPKYPNPNPQLHFSNCNMSKHSCEHQYSICNKRFKEDQLEIEMAPLSQAIMMPPSSPPSISIPKSSSPVIPPYTVSRVVADKETWKNYRSSTSSPNDRSRPFPWDEWESSRYSDKALVRILSGKDLVPLIMIETEEHVFIKFVYPKDKDFFTRKQKGSNTVVDILKFPFTLPFRLISGAVKLFTG